MYPWVHQYCNNWSFEDQTAKVTFPDINPSDLPHTADFSMAAGDFLEVYTEPGKKAAMVFCCGKLDDKWLIFTGTHGYNLHVLTFRFFEKCFQSEE